MKFSIYSLLLVMLVITACQKDEDNSMDFKITGIRDTVIPIVSRLASFQHAFVQRLSELGIAYRGSPIVEGPGNRYFDDSLRGGKGIGSRYLLVLGIDVEHINPAIDYFDIARNFFALSEVNAIAATPSSKQADLFFRLWTRKEAYLKATGRGITDGLVHQPSDAWILDTFLLPPDHLLSVAAFSPRCQFRLMPLPRLESLL